MKTQDLQYIIEQNANKRDHKEPEVRKRVKYVTDKGHTYYAVYLK